MYDGLALMPATVTSYGGSPLLKCINSLRTHAVLLAPMCQEILQDNELKKNFLAKAPNGHSVHEQALEMQQKNIKSFVKNYVMENIVNHLTQGKLRFFSHSLATGAPNDDSHSFPLHSCFYRE
jgi:hypothetical protein